MRRLLHFLAVAVALAASPASAQSLSFEEASDGVRLDAEDVSVEEAIDALSERFEFTVKIIRPSEVRLSGSRTGDAQELLNWVLTGHDRAIFVSKVGGQDKVTRVVVYGPSGNAPPPQPRQPDESGADPFMDENVPVEDIPPDGSLQDPQEFDSPPLDGGVDDFGGEMPSEPPLQ